MNKKDSSTISIVMINYNWINYLKRTIPKLLKLNYKNKEIIIVDNWSIDWSIEFIKSFKKIHLIQSPRLREKNYACNLWVKKAKWKYILLCDNDLLITEKNILVDLISMYKEKRDTWIIWLSYIDEWLDKMEWFWAYFWFFFIEKNNKISINEAKKRNFTKIWFPHWIWFFIKKSIWNKLWWYDDFLKFWWDDNDIWIKSWINWYKNYIYTKSVQIHIWLKERSDPEKFYFKFKNQVFSELYVIVKNYRALNMYKTLISYSIYLFLKSIKQSFEKKSILPFLGFLKGYLSFFKNLNIILRKRKENFKNRKIKKDIFLFIKK